ncbi:MAG: ribonuclease H [Bdellovibrionales bacterium]
MKSLNFFKNYWRLEIYTDGSHKGGYGSWAYLITRRGKCVTETSGRIRHANSNTMEFQAVIEALSSIPENSKVTLFSDSKILIDAMKFGEGPPAFQTQLQILKGLNEKHDIQWQWVKAHNGNKFNERCDELCTLARTPS